MLIDIRGIVALTECIHIATDDDSTLNLERKSILSKYRSSCFPFNSG